MRYEKIRHTAHLYRNKVYTPARVMLVHVTVRNILYVISSLMMHSSTTCMYCWILLGLQPLRAPVISNMIFSSRIERERETIPNIVKVMATSESPVK